MAVRLTLQVISMENFVSPFEGERDVRFATSPINGILREIKYFNSKHTQKSYVFMLALAGMSYR